VKDRVLTRPGVVKAASPLSLPGGDVRGQRHTRRLHRPRGERGAAGGAAQDPLRQVRRAAFEIVATVAPNIHGPSYVDIDFDFDLEKRTASVRIPDLFETESVPITWPPDNVENRVIVKMPNGFEYKEMEVAHAKMLKSSGVNKFEYRDNRHSSLALVEHTDKGLVA
jgi:hypothetical protein